MACCGARGLPSGLCGLWWGQARGTGGGLIAHAAFCWSLKSALIRLCSFERQG
jgi:hypothetical protein